MKKNKFLLLISLLLILLMGLSACGTKSKNSTEDNTQNTPNDISKSADDTSNEKLVEDNSDSQSSIEESEEQGANSEKENNPSVEEPKEVTNETTKLEGRKNEFIKKLDDIQKELDTMPEKKDSDKGVTNAMKNYYGVSYETYDKVLNEIYSLLKTELSPSAINKLKAEQIKWIDEKENLAKKESQKYEGGTFENVAYYISLYESTKKRSYELVNIYMTE